MHKTRTYIYIVCFIGFLASACSSSKPQKTPDEMVYYRATPPIDEKGAQEAYVAGNIALNEKNWENAKLKYRESISKNPKKWETYMNAAIATILGGRTDQALELMAQCFEHGGDKEQVAYYNLGNIYQERGLYVESVDAYRAGLAIGDENDLDSLLNIAAAYVIIDDFENAEKTYHYIMTVHPNDLAAYHGLAMIAHLQEDYETALKRYNEVLSRDPRYAQSLYNKGELLETIKRPREALEVYQTYLEVVPEGGHSSRTRSSIERIQRSLKK